jgi:CubicO group peptidase (beta-lactamase class C family)
VTGVAVALVQDERVVLARGFGVGDVQRRLPVTERTRFRIASNTKSMTAFLVATFVDEGVMSWDDRVVDVWPEFRAPTPELTAALRVRDLLGMGSGIAESPTIEFFMIGGGESALDVLRLDHDIRSTPLLALPEGGYVVTSGPGMILARKVTFAGDAATQLTMTIEGFDSVRWLTAG